MSDKKVNVMYSTVPNYRKRRGGVLISRGVGNLCKI